MSLRQNNGMIKFIGSYTAKVDDKGRVVFPSDLREQFLACLGHDGVSPEQVDWRFVVKKAIWAPCLEMYSFTEWEKESERIKAKINFLNKTHDAFWRAYTRDRALVEPDGKLGRVSIPKTLLESVGAGKELVFCGNDHKIEIWDREKYEQSALSADEFISLAESLSDN